MPFSVTWHTILEQLDEVPSDATFSTPLSERSFRVSDVQEHRLLMSYRDRSGAVPLKTESSSRHSMIELSSLQVGLI